MQLYAFEDNRLIQASVALRKKNYRCPECFARVRVRGGPHRQYHFFHLRTEGNCRQREKSALHLELQMLLCALLPEAQMERPFPTIGRIADVACAPYKQIFEIQCSSLTLEEAELRTQEYESLGWRIIWILSDDRFNKKKMSPAETFLRKRLCYFTNSKKIIYDQFEICLGSLRLFKGPMLSVRIGQLKSLPTHSLKDGPSLLSHRINQGFYLEGDFVDRLLKNPSSVERLEKFEERFFTNRSRKLPWKISFKKRYLSFFHFLLERLCP